MPIIFAQALLVFPSTIVSMMFQQFADSVTKSPRR